MLKGACPVGQGRGNRPRLGRSGEASQSVFPCRMVGFMIARGLAFPYTSLMHSVIVIGGFSVFRTAFGEFHDRTCSRFAASDT